MREDLDIEEIGGLPEDLIGNYVDKTTYNGRDFYIIYDKEGLMKELGFSDDDIESYLDEIFDGAWGYQGDWETCYNCGKAIYMEDYYSQDYWVDYEGSGLYCGDCVREVPEIRDAYLEFLANNVDNCNTFLSERQLEEAGLIKLEGSYESGYYGRHDNPSEIYNKLADKYPNGRFIFDLDNSDRWNTKYSVWAFPGYDEGAVENEE